MVTGSEARLAVCMLVGAMVGLGCGGLPPHAVSTLREADTMTVMALEPYPTDAEGERLHGFLVLSKATVDDPAERERIVDIVDHGAGSGTPAKCFIPRHGVTVQRGHDRVEVVICFECSQMHVHRGGDDYEMVTTSADGSALDERFRALGVTPTPR